MPTIFEFRRKLTIILESSLEKKVYDAISIKRDRPWANEEEVRVAWISAIENALGIHFDAERAKQDASYNNVIIEFKAPSFFKGGGRKN